jgi:hypothetical protein
VGTAQEPVFAYVPCPSFLPLGSTLAAAFSAQNNKDYLDQSLDEIKLLKYVNSMDPHDKYR